MTTRQFAALLGFGFVAAVDLIGFGTAILCLVGAAVGYLIAQFVQGELDLGDVQSRLQGGGGGGGAGAGVPPPAPPRTGPPRVR